MSHASCTTRFSSTFDDALQLCARAEVLVMQSAAAVTRARELRAVSRRRRLLVRQTRDYLASADIVFSALRSEVDAIAAAMREAGVRRRDAAIAVQDRVRSVLYGDGFREVEVEPVVARATAWVDEAFAA